MDLQTQKLHLIEEVLHLESPALVAQLADFLAQLKTQPASEGNLNELPPLPARSAEELTARFKQSLRELDHGEGIPHEQVVVYLQARHQ